MKKVERSKKLPVSIKHIVDFRDMGIHMETDILQKEIVIGRGIKKISLNLLQAEQMERLLAKQISKIKDTAEKENKNTIPHQQLEELLKESNAQFEEMMEKYLEHRRPLRFVEDEEKQEV